MGGFFKLGPKQKIFLSLISVVAFLFLLESLLPFEIVSPLQKILLPVQASIYKTKKDVKGLFQTVFEVGSLRSKNQNLEQETAFLQAENARLGKLEDENKILKDQLGVKSPKNKSILASVVGEDPIFSSSRLLLDKGSRDGVTDSSVVFVKDILVGQIFSVGPYSSTVRLLSDPETKIPVVTKSGVQGLAQGEFGNQLVLTKVAQNKNLIEGEFVFTSGESGLPRGMVVGRLGKVEDDPAQLFQKGQITLLLEPSLLEIMFISVEGK